MRMVHVSRVSDRHYDLYTILEIDMNVLLMLLMYLTI